jgi:vitamin B12 transporter
MDRKFLAIVVIAFTLLGAVRAHADGSSSSPPAQPASNAPGASRSKAATAPGKSSTASKQAGKSEAPSKPGEQQLSPIVVTATRIAQPLADIGTTLTVVDDQQINAQKIDHVENALRQVPGVIVTQSGSPGTEADVSIRGATAAQTLILIDGVEVNTSATGGFDMSNLPTDNVDRIEVLRGAGGSLYGSQAIGGVVNVLSEEGEGPAKATFMSEGGTRATSLQQATLNGSEGQLGYSGAISYFSTEGYRQFNDSSDNLAGSLRLDYHLSDKTVIRGFARYIRSNISLASFSVASGFALNTSAHQRSEFMLFKGEIEHHVTDQFMIRTSAYFVRDDIRLNSTPYDDNSSSEVDRIPDEIRGSTQEALYDWGSGFRTLAGFDFKDRWVRSDSVSVFPPSAPFISLFRARRQEYAGYLEQEGSFFRGHILVTGGFRVDGNSDFGEEVSPSWSVAIPINKLSTTLRGSYSEGFRAPSFNELFFPGFGNPNLKPEISSEYDGGFTTTFGEWGTFTSTYFSRRIHDLIVTVPAPGTPFGSEAGNAGRVDTQGVEIVPMVTPITGLSFGGYVTVLDETHANASGATAVPTRVPKYSAAALLQYVRSETFLPHDKITANVRYIFVGDRDDITVSSTIRNHQAYDRVDAVASYAAGIPAWRVRNEEGFIKFQNLLDRHYSEAFGFPAPSLTFTAGIKLELE